MRSTLASFACVALGAAASARQAHHAAALAKGRTVLPPTHNVLLLVLDDVGVDLVGAYASTYPTLPQPCTPNLDCLAERGVRFTNCWAAPVCTPTRGMILTGKLPQRTGTGNTTRPDMTLGRSGLQTDEYTLADLFRDGDPSAWSAIAIGKWHLADPTQIPSHPLDLGFARFTGSLFNLNVGPTVQPDCFDSSYCDWCKTSVDQLGMSAMDPTLVYATVDTTDEAIAAIEGTLSPADEPWLLYVNYNSPHSPFHCPQSCGYPCSSACEWCATCATSAPDAARAMSASLDAEIGRLLDVVDLESTAVIVIGDNGTQAAATLPPFDPFHAKVTVYQGGALVPLIAWVPGMPAACPIAGAPRTCDDLISATDVFATAAQIARLDPPPDARRDTLSFAHRLDPRYPPPTDGPRSLVCTEMFEPNFVPTTMSSAPLDYLAFRHSRAIRNGEYKLIERRIYPPNASMTGTTLELYRLSNGPAPEDPAFGPDPFEQLDLFSDLASWTSAEHDALALLRAELAARCPPLRGGLIAPSALSAEIDGLGNATCANEPLIVRCQTGVVGPDTSRALLDFDVGSIPRGTQVIEIELDLFIAQGAQDAASLIEVHPIAGPSTAFACQHPGGAFDAFGGAPYASIDGWDGAGRLKTVSLGAAAIADLRALLCATPPSGSAWFTLGLKLAVEDPAFEQSLAVGGPTSPVLPVLRVTVLPGAIEPCP